MKFTAFNLKKEIIEFLNTNNYLEATPVQEVVIPKALRNENIIVQSATGSGKTHSFLIPIMNNLEINNKIQAIIITPTRELARQTYEFALQFKQIFPELKVKIFTSGIDVSRNEKLAELMRRLRICEELGTGWDKIVISCELMQLPAPKISLYEENTKVTLFAEMPFSNISPEDKICITNEHPNCYPPFTSKVFSTDSFIIPTTKKILS